MFIIERIKENELHDKNSSNHPKDPNDNEIKELDYDTEVNKTNLMNYASIINYPIVWTYQFTLNEIDILYNCSKIAYRTGSTRLYVEELQPIIDRLKDNWKDGMWFFRFNSASPKDGNYEYPIYLVNNVISKIVTSKRALLCLEKKQDTIYFMEYIKKWQKCCEFRVFIYKNKMTAISQYEVSYDSYFHNIDPEKVKLICENIKKWLESELLQEILIKIDTNNVVVDIYIENDNTFNIIELNPFGYWLASGSSLFNWLTDKEKLYNTKGDICIRYMENVNI
jgi:hypothetical protein